MVNFLKSIRKEAGLSQPKLAQLINTTPQQIGMLEKGKRQLTQQWLERLSEALNCTPSEILYGEKTENKKSPLEMAKELEESLAGDDLLSPIIQSLSKVLEERAKK